MLDYGGSISLHTCRPDGVLVPSHHSNAGCKLADLSVAAGGADLNERPECEREFSRVEAECRHLANLAASTLPFQLGRPS